MIRQIALGGIGLMALSVSLVASSRPAISGDYVEARTAEVFTGGCIMNSEAETMGRQAVLAWRIGQGTFNGQTLDGLTVVAALAGDRNLGMREMGGESPRLVRAAVVVDERASPAQRAALVAFVKDATGDLVNEVVEVSAAPVRFERQGERLDVAAGDATLSVETRLTHDPSCGAMQWFHPLASGTDASVGLTKSQVYWGSALGTKWRQAERRSAFYGRFSM